MRDINKDLDNLALTRLPQLGSSLFGVDLALAVSFADEAERHGGESGR